MWRMMHVPRPLPSRICFATAAQPKVQASLSSIRQRTSAVLVVAKKGSNKTKAPSKADLPSKVCITCGRPFTWRKKWEKVWDEVKYCSDRCRSNRSAVPLSPAGNAPGLSSRLDAD